LGLPGFSILRGRKNHYGQTRLALKQSILLARVNVTVSYFDLYRRGITMIKKLVAASSAAALALTFQVGAVFADDGAKRGGTLIWAVQNTPRHLNPAGSVRYCNR
jgi:hypothetical protein